jgi:hypothetical protein
VVTARARLSAKTSNFPEGFRVLYTHIGQLPHHLDCWVDAAAVLKEPGDTKFVPARWFGLTAIPGRCWGCTVLLESGAVYRDLPPQAIAFGEGADSEWYDFQAQRWDCYGWQFTTFRYDALADLPCVIKRGAIGQDEEGDGRYLFTAAFVGDGFTADPTQAKQFLFLRTDGDRLTIQPTDKVMFRDPSWTTGGTEWPTGLKLSAEIHRCES